MVVPALGEVVGQRGAVGAVSSVGHVIGCAKSPAEAGDEIAGQATLPIVEENQPFGVASLADPPQFACHLTQGLVPGDLLPMPGAPLANPPHGMFDAVRVVEHLEPGLSLGAEPALVVGMQRVAIELYHAPVYHPRRDSTPACA